MTPFSSVAMLEKLALLKIAFCNAPVLSKALLRRISAPTSSTLPTSSSGHAGVPGSADIVLLLCRVVGIGAVQDRTARCQRCPCQQLTADRRPTRLNFRVHFAAASVAVGFPDATASMIPTPMATRAEMPIQI